MQRLLTWFAFILLTGGTVVAAVRVTRIELAGPPAFGRAELEAWLSATKPDQSSPIVRRAARQLDRDFHAGFDWQPTFDALPPARQPAFADRFQSLLALLIRQRADAYRAEPSHRRERFLDNQLQELANWYVVGKNGKLSGPAMFQQGLVAMNSPQVQSRTPPQVREFMAALQGHLLKRSLGRILPFGGDEQDR